MAFVGHLVIAAHEWNKQEIENPLYNEDLFEGDLKISDELILKFYNFSSLPEGPEIFQGYLDRMNNDGNHEQINISRAAAFQHAGLNLWPNNTVWYRLQLNISFDLKSLINVAFHHYEHLTCLRFLEADNFTRDYVLFTYTYGGCYSTSVGRGTGRQIINLGRGCERFDLIVHEIGHAIGFWHEQSRPDRDRYVHVNTSIIPGAWLGNFLRRHDFGVDYQGSDYDYFSVMHYSLTQFSFLTANTSEYNRQRKLNPDAPYSGLSIQDTLQVNRLYSCPCSAGAGIHGNLTIFIMHGINLSDPHIPSDILAPKVIITGVDCSSQHVLKHTQLALNNGNPTWNELIVLGVRNWQFFRISSWTPSGQLTMSQTVPVSATRKFNQSHCQSSLCSSYILIDYGVQKIEPLPTESKPPLVITPGKSSTHKARVGYVYFLFTIYCAIHRGQEIV